MKYQNARQVRRGLWLCALATGAACSSGSESAPPPVPPEPTAASSSVATTTTAELRTVPLPLVDENEDEDLEVKIRFVAYGDVDPNDDIDFELIPDVRIAIVYERELPDWWNTIGNNNLGYLKYIPPGAQVQSSAKDIAASQVDFVTTESDGTTEIYVLRSEVLSFCAVSPSGSSIAGCSPRDWTGDWPDNAVSYVYFSHGRAYFDRGLEGSERYHRLLYRDQDSYTSSLNESAMITFVSMGYAEEYYGYGFTGPYFTTANIAIIDDINIDLWWNAVSDNGAISDLGVYSLNAYPTELGWSISYDNATHQRVRESVPVRFVYVDWSGTNKINLAPGNYLFCDITDKVISSCDYEDIVAAQSYVFGIDDFQIQKLPDSEGRQLLEDAKNWEFEP